MYIFIKLSLLIISVVPNCQKDNKNVLGISSLSLNNFKCARGSMITQFSFGDSSYKS